MNIPLFKPYISSKCSGLLQKVFESGILSEGEYSDKFEKQFGDYIDNPNVALTNSCTSALHLAGILSGLKQGDEVVTTAMTCMATNEPFFNMGVVLKFADVDPRTGNICPQSIRKQITPKTKAIIVVHWAGQPADLNQISEIAKEYNLKVIEDAAHALGASYHNKKIGGHSDFVCFSFQAIKHLTCGDGGALACKNPADAERARKIRWFGLDRKVSGTKRWEQDITESGYKYHMNNINAAIGLCNLQEIDFVISSHIQHKKFYDSEITNSKIEKLSSPEGTISSSWLYSMLVEDRTSFIAHLNSAGIACDRVHVRNDQYSIFHCFAQELPNLNKFDNQLVNIPVGWWLTQNDLKYIVDTVNSYEN